MANPVPPGKLRAQIGKSIDEDEQLFFMHIPKTAGTSLIAVLDQRYTIDEICPLDIGAEENYLALSIADRGRYKFIRGHFPYSLVYHLNKPRTLTFLRNPVARTLSAISHHKRLEKQGVSFFKEYSLENMTIEAFLDHQELRNFVCNKAVQYLNDITKRIPGGKPVIDLSEAKERLETFDFLGLTENFKESLSLLTYTFDLYPISNYQMLQVSPDRGREEPPSREVMDRLVEMNSADIELYEFGQKLFNERIAQAAESQVRNLKLYPPSSESNIEFDFRRVHPGQGWHVGELHPTMGVCRWSGPDTRSKLFFQIARESSAKITFTVVAWMTPEILNSLKLFVNGENINLEKKLIPHHGGYSIEGRIPVHVFKMAKGESEFVFQIGDTVRPIDIDQSSKDVRRLGLCFTDLSIRVD